MWLQRGLELLRRRSACPRESDVAADPFFGRAGKMLADGQKEQKLKFEVLVPVISERQADRVLLVQLSPGPLRPRSSTSAPPTASVAHTACLGFGLERL